MNVKLLLYAVIGGVIGTLLTGLIVNTPPMLVGATHYGYPFPWLTRLIIAPQYFPWRVNVLNLIGDIIVWTVIAGVVQVILGKIKTPSSSQK